jgi:hypothetical protein
MIALPNRENLLAAGLGGAMILAVVALFLGTHYQPLFHPAAVNRAANAASTDSNGLNIPTIDEMCKAQGATSANMGACQNDEQAAAEFVIAWMGLNGFLTNGAIDVDQIQLAASLADSEGTSGVGLGDPSLSGDPTLGGDPADADPTAEPNIDPATGLPVSENLDSPAQIAMFCMSSSDDWLKMHDCISRYDPSSRFTGN